MSSPNWANVFRKKPSTVKANKQKNRNLWSAATAATTTATANAPNHTKRAKTNVNNNFVFNVNPQNTMRRELLKKLMDRKKTHYSEPWKTRRNVRQMSPLNPKYTRAAPKPLGNFLTNDELYN